MTESPRPESMSEQAIEELIKSIGIPPRPSLLADVQQEIAKDGQNNSHKIIQLVAQDVAMSALLIKSANSSFFNLKRKADSVEQAALALGSTQCTAILSGLIMRKIGNLKAPPLTRYWDVSTKRSRAMVSLANTLGLCSPGVAHTFGLFCDIGIPMLMTRFPDYIDTLKAANDDGVRLFTDIEESRHGTNHATIGAILARSWGLSADVTLAIRVHHDYDVMNESTTPDVVKILMAMCLLSERAIQRYQRLNYHVEWEKGGPLACDILNLTDDEVIDRCEDLYEIFNAI